MATQPNNTALAATHNAAAVLVLSDGTVFRGVGLGAHGRCLGEVCFNTSMTGYQEVITDPSYAGQIIAFTFPHIGNVGANDEDTETTTPATRGVIVRASVTDPANQRSLYHFDTWLKSKNLVGISGIDTRRLTRLIRDGGAQIGVIAHEAGQGVETSALLEEARTWPGLEGMDLAQEVSCAQSYTWSETTWQLGSGFGQLDAPKYNVVAVDFGAKRNILRCLAAAGCNVVVVPATATAEDILRHKPDGVFLSNGPGDPAATGAYAVPMIIEVMNTGVPLFGICLGHQLLARALGAKTLKMHMGHRGANHPVKDLATRKVEITSQNHGFVVDGDTLPDGVTATHVSLFDNSLEGLKVEGKPVFSVQFHPEASPGPHDSHYLFKRFTDLMAR